ncbi:MAG: hypothetical protein ACHP84_03385 [Caulobacterales bacterium]
MRFNPTVLGACLALAAGAQAEPLRVQFDAPQANAPAPTAFVIDAQTEPGGVESQTTVKGWFAALPPNPAQSGEVEGSCIEARCALKATLEDGEFNLTGDFGRGGGAGRFKLNGDDGKAVAEGPLTARPITGALPGLGVLAALDAVSGLELVDLLDWNGTEVGQISGQIDPKEPPDDSARESLATWQGQKGRPMTGLIFVGELAELRAGADAARRTAGWAPATDLGPGVAAAYPAAALPRARPSGKTRRFESADGHAWVEIATEAALTSDAFDALVERLTADDASRSQVNYTRVNDHLELSYEKAGRATLDIYESRERGLIRLEYSYPSDKADSYARFTGLIQRSFQVARDGE